jgi:hypothetical protein
MKDEFKVEVEEDGIVLVLPMRMDTYTTTWQSARQLAEVMLMAAKDVPQRSRLIDPTEVNRETERVKLNSYKDTHVVLVFDWTDRIKLSPTAAVLVAQAMKIKSQDLELLQRGVRMTYPGGLATPINPPRKKRFF